VQRQTEDRNSDVRPWLRSRPLPGEIKDSGVYFLLGSPSDIMATCLKCDQAKKNNQLIIQCKNCQFFCHYSCSSIPTYREFHKIQSSKSWICERCRTSSSESCAICRKQDKRKITLSCSQCNVNYRRACHNSKYPKHESNIQSWVCSKCNFKPLNIDTPIDDPSEKQQCNLSRGIKIGHLNVRDLLSKSKLIKTIIARVRYDVFTISETWLWYNNEDSEIKIDGYEVIRCDRPSVKSYNKRGGGSLAYVNKKYELTEMKHNFTNPDKVQVVKFSIHKQYMKPILILSIYRVADTPATFIKQLETEVLQSTDKEMFIVGDLNIDQLAPWENQLKPIITSYGLQQLITTLTRVTEKTNTLIDVIITNSPHFDIKTAGVTRSGISDHDIVFQ
jgi:hypothetical protein